MYWDAARQPLERDEVVRPREETEARILKRIDECR